MLLKIEVNIKNYYDTVEYKKKVKFMIFIRVKTIYKIYIILKKLKIKLCEFMSNKFNNEIKQIFATISWFINFLYPLELWIKS